MMSYLLYVPITLVVFVVLETCKHDDVSVIVRKSLRGFFSLTGVLAGGAVLLYFIQRSL